jgi:hypothetical protein
MPGAAWISSTAQIADIAGVPGDVYWNMAMTLAVSAPGQEANSPTVRS